MPDTKPASSPYDESAAQVRRLVDRDRKELDYDALEDNFKSAGDAADDQPRSTSESTRIMTASMGDFANKTPVSPFGPSSSSSPSAPSNGSSSPFGTPSGLGSGSSFARKPFTEPSGLRPDMPPADIKSEPWWTKITFGQIVIVLSFTTIIGLMLATCAVVFNVGAIHFND
ncbi:hypothetical protein N2152v2_003723 [Parachlorella kessleri]